MAPRPKTQVRYRSAVDGQFETKAKAQTKPREHIKDTMPAPRRASRPKKK
jgi:hypothetical protein